MSSRMSPRFVSRFVESTRNGSPCLLQYASVSSRQSESRGRTTPSSRRGLIAFVVPEETMR